MWLQVWEGRWRVIPYDVLPDWLKDNDYLLHGHRPPMPSFRACFRSIFRIHTETGNIWTHLLGEGSGGQWAHLLAQELCGLCPREGETHCRNYEGAGGVFKLPGSSQGPSSRVCKPRETSE